MTSVSIFIIYKKTNPNTYTFMSIGDGISLGLNPSGIKSYSYNDYIKKYLKDNNKEINYFNYSEKNISIAELTNDIIYLNNKILKEYLQKSDLIIISIGEKEINDNKLIKTIEEDLTNLITEIKKYNNNICLLGRYNINEERENLVKEINEVYKKVSKNNKINYINIDNSDYFINNNDYNYQTINGYEEIGKMLVKLIKLNNN